MQLGSSERSLSGDPAGTHVQSPRVLLERGWGYTVILILLVRQLMLILMAQWTGPVVGTLKGVQARAIAWEALPEVV